MIVRNDIWLMIMLLLVTLSCSKMEDPVKPFVEGGEIIYSTKVDSLNGLSGRNRVILQWKLPINHSMKRTWAFWNNNKDSVALDVIGIENKWYKAELKNLKEGTYLFDIYTEDAEGNRSVKTMASVNVYGEIYESTLLNRGFISAVVNSEGEVIADFSPAESTEVGTEIYYIDKNNLSKQLTLGRDETKITIKDWKESTEIRYRSKFLPSSSAIDIVEVIGTEVMPVKMDISANYLKNYKQPFIPIQQSNRFRDPQDWAVTLSVQNHGGMGGWSSDNNTVLNMESGWGSPNIINGKMYQTLVLPKGDYSIELELGANGIASSKVKILAVSGSSIPDFGMDFQVPGALGSADLQQSKFRFSNPSDGLVTIGFLANMIGDQHWTVRRVTLFKHY